MAELDDFGELYADLEDQVIVGVLTAESEEEDAEEEDMNVMEERGAGCENGYMESGSSSDSEDDLQIVLNEEDYTSKLPAQLLTGGRDFEEDEGDDLVIVNVSDCSGKESNVAEHVHSADGLLQGNGDRGNATKGAHRNWSRPCLAGSAVRAWKSLSGLSHRDYLTLPCSFGKSSYNSGFPMAFSNGCDFYLPRNRIIFNIDVESFECKPWRFNGVDITDYFNFGLDEEGWRTYCTQLVHFQQNKLPLHESSKLNKPTGIMLGEVAHYGRDNGHEIPGYLNNGMKGMGMPKGQAIQVESGNGNRIPSIDVRRRRNRDSDVVIQITTGLAVEDVLDPIIDGITHVDDNGSKNKLLLHSNEVCKSSFIVGTCAHKCEGSSNSSECSHPDLKKPFDENLDIMNRGRDRPSSSSIMSLSKPDDIITDFSSPKSSDHNGSFEVARDEVSLEKVSSPECIHLNSDSLLQDSVLSHCYPSSETGSDTNKTNRTSCGGHSPEFLLDLNYCQQTVPDKVVELNHSSDDEVAFPLVHRQKIDGEHLTEESGTIVRQWHDEPDERFHSNQGGKISLKNNIKYYNRKEANAAILARLKGNDDDPSPVRNSEKKATAREVKIRTNVCCSNQSLNNNCRTYDIINTDYLQSTSPSLSLYDKMVCRSRRVEGRGMVMKANYNSMETEDRHREISLDECRERSFDKSLGQCFHEDESYIDKYDSVLCSAGALRRLQELDCHGKIQPLNLVWPSRYVYNHEDPRLYEDGLHRRIYREAYDGDKRGWHEEGSHRNEVPSLFKLDKRNTCHSGHSRTKETFSELRSKHDIIISKKSRLFSRTAFNLENNLFPGKVRKAYHDSSAYNECRKSTLAMPGLLAKEEGTIRLQDCNNLFSPKRYSVDGTVQLQKCRVDKSSFSKQKIYDNHLHNSRGNKITVRSSKNSDSWGRVGSFSDNFIKNRRELDIRGYRQTVSEHLNGWKVKTKERCTNNGGSNLFGTEIASFKELRGSAKNEESSYYNNMKRASNYFYPTNSKVGSSNHSVTKSSNKHSITEVEIEELEEGQLIEESDNHETAEIKCNSDGRTPPLTANAKVDLTNPMKKNKLAGRYDTNHLLETLARMEKRLQRFKDPIPLKKEPENCGNMKEPVATIEDEVKQHRPARKRKWGIS